MKKYKLLRELDLRDYGYGIVPIGTTMYECIMPTYGCITGSGLALTLNYTGDYPFFEVPSTHVEKTQ